MTPAIAVSGTRSLAVLGEGGPRFADKLHVGRPNVGDRAGFLRRVGEALDRNWLTNDGPLVQELEARVAAYLGARHCVAMSNATAALEVAARALGLRGEVIVPSYTFVATAHALQWLQLKPVFADIRESDHCLDPAAVERAITPQTTAILGVHLWGGACDIAALDTLSRRHRLQLLFDAAHAFGCAYEGRMIGTHGRCEVFSFHATKFFNTIEGGALVTNDDDVARAARLMRNFGFVGYDAVASVGINAKMSEVSAAMGLANLDSLPALVDANRANLEAYAGELQGLDGLSLLRPRPGRHNFQYVVVEVAPQCALSRDELLAVLWAENVVARKYFWPGCHRMEPYRTLDPAATARLPVTERVAARVLVLPTGTAVDAAAIRAVGGILRAALSRAPEVRAALPEQ